LKNDQGFFRYIVENYTRNKRRKKVEREITPEQLRQNLLALIRDGRACAVMDAGELRFYSTQYLTPEIVAKTIPVEQVEVIMALMPLQGNLSVG